MNISKDKWIPLRETANDSEFSKPNPKGFPIGFISTPTPLSEEVVEKITEKFMKKYEEKRGVGGFSPCSTPLLSGDWKYIKMENQ